MMARSMRPIFPSIRVVLTLFLFISAFSPSVHSTYLPLTPGYKVVNNDTLNGRVKNGDITRYIILDESSDYALAFFNAGPASSSVAPASVYYLSIVTKSGGDPSLWNLVWSTNREKPVQENASVTLDTNGNLVLTDADGTLVWSTGTSSLSTTAALLDSSGNLQLLDAANATLWQSFDTPTDSLVPGQRLNTGSSLVAAKSTFNPTVGIDYSSGPFSLAALPGGLALFKDRSSTSAGTAYFIQSAESELHDLNSVEKTCRHPNDIFFDSKQGLVIYTEVTEDAPASDVDPSLCGHGDTLNITVVIPSMSNNDMEGGATQRFVRIDPDGSLTLYQYDVNSRAFLKAGSVNTTM